MVNKRKIYFRADASASIGYGHFVRTLALADMLKDVFDCTFFTQSPTEYQRVEVKKVCPLVELPSDDSKFDIFYDILCGDEVVVLDNYFFSTEYQRKIKRKGCKLVCVDDIHDKHYVADIVINHGLNNPAFFSKEPYTMLCLGLDWAMLRRPFLQPNDKVKKEKGSWFVSFGGSDYYNLTEKFVRLIRRSGQLNKITAVVGDAYKYIDTLEGFENVSVLKNLTAEQMSDVMRKSEFAILPASSVCIEAISQNCIVYSGFYVDNQEDVYACLKEQKLVFPLGDLNNIDNFSPDDFYVKHLKPHHVDFSLMSLKYKLLFNSLGSSFVYEGLTFVDYVSLSLDNHRHVWEARNHEDIRKCMDSSDLIPWSSHCKFVNRLFFCSQRRYWAVYKNDVFIGSVNISYITDVKVERGIFIAPDKLGQSWGTKLEKASVEYMRNLGIREIDAKVLHENDTSLYFHYRNGYKEVNSDDRYVYLVKNIR